MTKILPLVTLLSLAIGFGAGIAFQVSRSVPGQRYQIISAGQSGNAFRMDVVTGDTWLLTPSGDETLVLPPEPQFTLKQISDLHKTMKDAKVDGTPETLRDYSIQMNHLSDAANRKRGLYDNGALRSVPEAR